MRHHYLHRYWIKTFILFIIALAIKLFSLNHTLVEQYYSTGIYVFISSALRIITGLVPFSIGDVLYAATVVWIIIIVIRQIIALFKRSITRKSFVAGVFKTINVLLFIYIIFYAAWGLNYDRKGIASQLQLKPENETTQDLSLLTD